MRWRACLCLTIACGEAPQIAVVTEDPIEVVAPSPGVTMVIDPTADETDPTSPVLFQEAAKQTYAEGARAQLAADLFLTNTEGKPLHLEKVEVSYGGRGAPSTIAMTASQLLNHADGQLLSGGYDVDGLKWEDDPAYATEQWNDVAARLDWPQAYYFAGEGDSKWIAARYGTDGARIEVRNDFLAYSVARANAIKMVRNGRVMAVGGAHTPGDYFAIARYYASDDGAISGMDPDPDFAGDGNLVVSIPNCEEEEAIDFANYLEGTVEKYVVVGRAKCGGVYKIGLVRRNQNGTNDPSFNGGAFAVGYANADARPAGVGIISVNGAPQIYVAASVGNDCSPSGIVAGTCRISLLRLHWNGNVIGWSQANATPGTNHGATGLAVDGSKRVLMSGWLEHTADGKDHFAVARFRDDGTPDPAFGIGGGGFVCGGCPPGNGMVVHSLDGYEGYAEDVAFLDDGRIAAAGWARTPLGTEDFAVATYADDGEIDWMTDVFWGVSGAPTRTHAYGIAQDHTDRIVTAGVGRNSSGDFLGAGRFASAVLMPDGKASAGSAMMPGETRKLMIPDDRFWTHPFPDSIRVKIWYQGWGTPSSIAKTLEKHETSYDFFSKAIDMPEDTYWSMRTEPHALHENHRKSESQRYGYDWGMNRWTGTAWSNLIEGGSSANNDDYVIWGMPIYAMEDGDVISCYFTRPDNPSPPAKLPGVGAGGNHFWIRHDSGDTVLYAHFQAGTVNTDLCPTEGEQMMPYPRVEKGEILGQVGNSGQSTGPHLHLHAERNGQGVPLHFDHYKSTLKEDMPIVFVNQTARAPVRGPTLAAPLPPPGTVLGCTLDGLVDGGDYEGHVCGSVAGGPCASLTASWYDDQFLIGVSAPSDPSFHPNGNFSYHHRCTDDVETGLPMSCISDGAFPENPICKICGVPDGTDDPTLFTLVGCEEPDGGCTAGYNLWPDGRCWPDGSDLPEWECEADCAGMFNGWGWCMHDLDWRQAMQSKSMQLSAYPWNDDQYNFADPICASTDCDGDGVSCSAQGLTCAPDTETCVEECWDDSDCQATLPPPAYPGGFICHLPSHTCVLSFEAKP